MTDKRSGPHAGGSQHDTVGPPRERDPTPFERVPQPAVRTGELESNMADDSRVKENG